MALSCAVVPGRAVGGPVGCTGWGDPLGAPWQQRGCAGGELLCGGGELCAARVTCPAVGTWTWALPGTGARGWLCPQGPGGSGVAPWARAALKAPAASGSIPGVTQRGEPGQGDGYLPRAGRAGGEAGHPVPTGWGWESGGRCEILPRQQGLGVGDRRGVGVRRHWAPAGLAGPSRLCPRHGQRVPGLCGCSVLPALPQSPGSPRPPAASPRTHAVLAEEE